MMSNPTNQSSNSEELPLRKAPAIICIPIGNPARKMNATSAIEETMPEKAFQRSSRRSVSLSDSSLTNS